MPAKSFRFAFALAVFTVGPSDAVAVAPFSSASGNALPAPWRITSVPNVARQTRYSLVRIDDRTVVKAEADASYANALHPLRVDIDAKPVLRFSWSVERFPSSSNLATKEGDDLAAKVCVLFDLPLDRLSLGDRVPMLVLRSAAASDQDTWFDEKRDLRADFARAFGIEASAGLPPAVAIAIATDADNTGSSALAYFGDITLTAQ